MSKSKTNKRGRPSIEVAWPEGDFTIRDVVDSLALRGQPISKVAVQIKANKALGDGLIRVCGKRPSTVGRSQRVFRKMEEDDS